MNILWLDLASRVGRYDGWLHVDFAVELRKYVKHLYFYAPHMNEKFDNALVPIRYNPTTTIKNIVSRLGINVIIVNTRSAMYEHYWPKMLCPEKPSVGDCWLPKDFAECKTLKLCIEEDFHYETDAVWHKEMGFKAVLQKHYSQSLRKLEVPFESFPFSVDTSIFYDDGRTRRNKICFAGTSELECYPQRYIAHEKLREHGLIDVFRNHEMFNDKYINCLKNYVSHLSCGSRYNLTSAKNFEIMSSGSVLFTNKFMGIEKQFDEGSYVTYENDFSDLFEKANKIVSELDFRNSVIKKALNCIRTRHTHEVRIKELLNLIEKYK